MYPKYILKVFNRPYPYLFSTKRNLIIAVAVGLFVYAINLTSIDESLVNETFLFSKQTVCILAGFTTFLGILVVTEWIPYFFFKPELKENWTIGKECLLIVSLLFLIAIFNNIMSFLISKESFSFNVLFGFLNASFYVVAIGLVPALLIIWLNYTVLLKENLRQVSLYNEQLEREIIQKVQDRPHIEKIQTNNKNEVIPLDLNTFLFAKAEGNYSDIFTKVPDGFESNPYRITIQQLDEALHTYPYIINTHRSYIVNMKHIHSTSGNARNYRIHFDGVDMEVPVSRSKFKIFEEAFTVIKA